MNGVAKVYDVNKRLSVVMSQRGSSSDAPRISRSAEGKAIRDLPAS